MKKCEKCGTEAESKFCPNCGTELIEVVIENDENKVDDVEVDDTDTKDNLCNEINKDDEIKKVKDGKRKKITIAIILVLTLLVGSVIIITAKNNNKEEYAVTINTFIVEVLDGAAKSEKQGNLIKRVWYDAIYNESNDETKKYVTGAEDFNEALDNLFNDDKTVAAISEITNNQDDVKELMEKLSNPPEEFEAAYDVALDLYSKYNSFTEMATDPTGSYNSYSDKFSDVDSEVLELYNKLSAMI